MLRSIGIPARIGLGFTQGDPVANETGTYIVHGHDYHSWVEVPFEGYGWLTFDPTPGFDDPSSLSYAKFTAAVQQCSPAQGHNCSGSKGDGTRTNRPGPIHVGDVKAGITNGIQGGSQSTPRRALGGIDPVEPRHDRGGARASCSRSGSRSCTGSGGAGACTPRAIPAGLILATYDVFTDRARELGVGRSPGRRPRSSDASSPARTSSTALRHR